MSIQNSVKVEHRKEFGLMRKYAPVTERGVENAKYRFNIGPDTQ
jgi:hypothetical protein